MSAGIGLAGVLSGFVENGASLNSFLFGSIVSISEGELALVVVISVLVLAAVLFYRNCFISDLMKMRQESPVFPCGILIFFYYSDGSDSFHCVPYSRNLDRFLHAGSSGGVWDADGKKL